VMPRLPIAFLVVLALAACNDSSTQQTSQQTIKVTSAEQQQLKQLDAINLAIGLKRAIYDAGYTCKRVTDAGFVGAWKNNDMWMAHCVYDNGKARDWAIFAGPDGSAQVRDCVDIKAGNRQLSAAEAIPECSIKHRPKGSFTELK
jgi:hypothetical protein